MNPNMFYQNPMVPNNMMPNQMMPNQMMPNNFQNFNNDIEMRLEALERQTRRLETRISKLENPLSSNQGYSAGVNTDTSFNNFQSSMHMM